MTGSLARTSVSYAAGLIATFTVAVLNFNDSDPFIFGIYAFVAFIVCASVTWFLTGILSGKISRDAILRRYESEDRRLVDVTIGGEEESNVLGQDAGDRLDVSDRLLEGFGSNGTIDWDKLSPVEEEGLSEEFAPFEPSPQNREQSMIAE